MTDNTMAKEKGQKGKQQSTKHYTETTYRATLKLSVIGHKNLQNMLRISFSEYGKSISTCTKKMENTTIGLHDHSAETSNLTSDVQLSQTDGSIKQKGNLHRIFNTTR
jgi:hypothetical protein